MPRYTVKLCERYQTPRSILLYKVNNFKSLTVIHPAHEILILTALSNNEDPGEPVHMHRLARAFAVRIYKELMKKKKKVGRVNTGTFDHLSL